MVERIKACIAWISAQWWTLWTGQPSLTAKRHEIEEDARRFGGRVVWEDAQ